MSERFFVLELLGGPGGEAVLALELQVGPGDFALRVGLARHEKPVVGFGDSQIDRFVGALLLGLGLALLELVEVQRHAVVPNRGPCEVLPDGLLQLSQAVARRRRGTRACSCKLRGDVPRESRIAAASCRAGLFSSRFACGKSGAKDDQPGFAFVGHVAARNAGMNLGEVGPRAGCFAQPLDDLVARSGRR